MARIHVSESAPRWLRVCHGPIFGVGMCGAVFFVALAAVSGRGVLAAADRRLLSVASAHRARWLSVFARWCTHLGSAPVVLGVAAVTIVLCVIRKRTTGAVLIALSISITAGAVRIVKEIVGRPGPHPRTHLGLNGGKAFPSGHSAQAIACYFALGWILNREIASRRLRALVWAVSGLLCIAVGWSRVYVRVHWLSDVLAGWALAAAVLVTLVAIVQRRPAVRHRCSMPRCRAAWLRGQVRASRATAETDRIRMQIGVSSRSAIGTPAAATAPPNTSPATTSPG